MAVGQGERVLGLLLLLAETAPIDSELLLVCEGGTLSNMQTAETYVSAYNNRGYRVDGNATTREPGRIDYSVKLRIRDGIGEMSVPDLVVPELSSGKQGWFPVKDLKIGDDEISGRVRFNFVSSSSFRIDRRTGDISTSGGFVGKCVKQDLSQRAF